MTTPVPVLFSFSNQFAPYGAAAIRSLIAHASEERVYHVYIFYNEITAYNMKKISRMRTKNVEIIFRSIAELVKDREFYVPVSGGSKETYYRILAVECLKNYEKLVYLDSDVILLRDVAELYDEDVSQYVFGAVRNYNDYGSLRHIEGELKLPPDSCFNAGVLVINTKKFMEMDIQARCMDLLEKIEKPHWADQDLLNLICWQDTKLLDERWNVQSHGVVNEQRKKPERLKAILDRVVDDPFLVHYSGVDRPWLAPQCELAEFFWKYARQTEFYEEIIYRNVGFYKNEGQAFLKYLFPFDRVKRNSRVVLYGMGKVGAAFFAQNGLTGYCQLLFCVDRDYRQIPGELLPVLPPKTLKNDMFDFVVIAVEDRQAREGIAEDLRRMGVPSEKIVAENPLKSRSEEIEE